MQLRKASVLKMLFELDTLAFKEKAIVVIVHDLAILLLKYLVYFSKRAKKRGSVACVT